MIIITKKTKQYLKCKKENKTYPKSPLPEIITINILVSILANISLVYAFVHKQMAVRIEIYINWNI